MHAVIKTGGKQYRVAKNDIILVERLPGDAGEPVLLDEVLMVGDGGSQTVGMPYVSGAAVAATILDQPRSKKITVFKKNRRKNYQRTAGHRQDLTVLKITEILEKGKKPAKAKKLADEEAKTIKGDSPKKSTSNKSEVKKVAEKKKIKKAAPAKPKTNPVATSTAKKPSAAAADKKEKKLKE
jgi:large subunit ribosomal protein L21